MTFGKSYSRFQLSFDFFISIAEFRGSNQTKSLNNCLDNRPIFSQKFFGKSTMSKFIKRKHIKKFTLSMRCDCLEYLEPLGESIN